MRVDQDDATDADPTFSTASPAAISSRQHASNTKVGDVIYRFLCTHERVLVTKLSIQYPQFTADLRSLLDAVQVQQEDQSARVSNVVTHNQDQIASLERQIYALREKEAEQQRWQQAKQDQIAVMTAQLAERDEQVDVLLDEVVGARKKLKEESAQIKLLEKQLAQHQVEIEQSRVPAMVATVNCVDEESAVSQVIQDSIVLPTDLSALESKLNVLENQSEKIQKSINTSMGSIDAALVQKSVDTSLFQRLQEAVEAMELSSVCAKNPFALYYNSAALNNADVATCLNLEHHLQAQAIQIEHLHDSFSLMRQSAMRNLRDFAIHGMKYQLACAGKVVKRMSQVNTEANQQISKGSFQDVDSLECTEALRCVLLQTRTQLFGQSTISKSKKIAKNIAKAMTRYCDREEAMTRVATLIEKWAQWEESHLHELQSLRHDFSHQYSMLQRRIDALMEVIDALKQRETDLCAENAMLKGMLNSRTSAANIIAVESKSYDSPATRQLSYPELLLKLATLEQVVHAKDEQLNVADKTIHILSTGIDEMGSKDERQQGDYISKSSNATIDKDTKHDIKSMVARCMYELRLTKNEQIELHRYREKELVNVAQYFQLEKNNLFLKTKLDAERERVAFLEAQQSTFQQNAEHMIRKFRELQKESLFQQPSLSMDTKLQQSTFISTCNPGWASALHFACRHLHLLEKDRQTLDDRVKHLQTRVVLLEQQLQKQRPIARSTDSCELLQRVAAVLEQIADHHQKCATKFHEIENRNDNHYNEPVQQRLSSEPIQDNRHQGTLSTGEPALASLCPMNTHQMVTKDIYCCLLNHYEALWVSFYHLYSSLSNLRLFPSEATSTSEHCSPDQIVQVLKKVFTPPGLHIDFNGSSQDPFTIDKLMTKLRHQEKKILLLQQELLEKEEQVCSLLNDAKMEDVSHKEFSTFLQVSGYTAVSIDADKTNHIDQKATSDKSALNYHSYHDGLSMESLPPANEESPLQLEPLDCRTAHDHASKCVQNGTLSASATLMNNAKQLLKTQHELEECITKISTLTAQNASLTQKLRDAKKEKERYAQEQKKLLLELSQSTSANVELSQDLALCQQQIADAHTEDHQPLQQNKSNTMATISNEQKQLEEIVKDLASREKENLKLFQSLCEMKKQLSEADEVRTQLEKQVRSLESKCAKQTQDKESEHASTLESYMNSINKSLENIDKEKERLMEENQMLKLQLKAYVDEENSAQRKKEQNQKDYELCTKSTETTGTDLEFETEKKLQERDQLLADVQCLEQELVHERKKIEQLEEHNQRQADEQRKHLEESKSNYETMCDKIQRLNAQLHHEFVEYQAAAKEARLESDKRLAYLTACVEECARLVDSPSHEMVTTKDIHDTIVSLSRNLVVVTPTSKSPKNRSKSALSASIARRNGQSETEKGTAQLKFSASHQEDLSGELHRDFWRVRTSRLEELVRAFTFKNQTLQETVESLKIKLEETRTELKDRMAKETSLMAKLAVLKGDSSTVKANCASLASRYAQVCDDLQRRNDEIMKRDDDIGRLRSGMVRKSELLTRHKQKLEALEKKLEAAQQKSIHLIGMEKTFVAAQQKSKMLTTQLQHLRHQLTMYQEENAQLSYRLEREKDQVSAAAARGKALRSEISHLRTQIQELKKSFDTAKVGNDKQLSPSENEPRMTEENKMLKRRVLQKQEVIVGYKAKLADTEAELEALRTKMFELAQANRMIQQDQRHQKEAVVCQMASMKEEMADLIHLKQDQLDGLRASLYDSFEAFLHCSSKSITSFHHHRDPIAASLSSSTSSGFTFSEYLPSEHSQHDRKDASTMELRRWTDLSARDLEDLQMDKLQSERARTRKHHNEDGKYVLQQLEDALERSPEDCRAEICEFLKFLCNRA